MQADRPKMGSFNTPRGDVCPPLSHLEACDRRFGRPTLREMRLSSIAAVGLADSTAIAGIATARLETIKLFSNFRKHQ